MTDYAIAAGIVLVLLPAIFGWFVLVICIAGAVRDRRREAEKQAKVDAWVKVYNEHCVSNLAAEHLTPYARKRDAFGRLADAHKGTPYRSAKVMPIKPGDDGPKAA